MIEPFTRFGKWVVIRPAERYIKPKSKNKECQSLCRCDCGSIRAVRDTKLRGGESLSCGCVWVKHGDSNSPEWLAWIGMRGRCKSDKNYSERGITICPRWDSFENFLSDMGRKPADKDSIDRKNNNGNYTPENCRWATNSEQQRNKRTNRIISFLGISLPLIEWSERTGIGFGTLWWRLDKGWDIDRVLGYDLSKYKKGDIV